LGFGPSAFSYWEKERFKNVSHLKRYASLLQENKSAVDFRERLSDSASTKELLAVRLHLTEGVDLTLFNLEPETKKAIERLRCDNLVSQEGSKLKLTERGKLFYDTVASEII
jgi:oxygen-independent coproporphyrinogen-3 oxidase